MSKVGIIMESDADLPVMKDCGVFLEGLGIEYELNIISAHKTPEKMFEFAKSARSNGFSIIIAGAGGASHLPGMVASLTTLPVIGVPVKSSNLSGLDSLLSITQMPTGIPVAAMAINGATNAGILAARILSINNEEIASKLDGYMASLKDSIAAKSDRLLELGSFEYLSIHL